jgi:hypothetical protein
MYAQTADFSVMRNFPVYDAWDGLICVRPAVSWPRFPAKLSVFMAIYGKFEREISGNGPPGIFGLNRMLDAGRPDSVRLLNIAA